MSDNTLYTAAVLAFFFMAFDKGCADEQARRTAEADRLRQRAAAPLVETCITHSVLDKVEVR